MTKSRILPFALAFGGIALVYEILVFTILGFKGHLAGFWINNVLFLISVGIVIWNMIRLLKGVRYTTDVILGWPIIRHTVIFMIFTVVVGALSNVSLITKFITWIPFTVLHVIGIGVYLVMTITGFIHKETIEKVENTIAEKRSFSEDLKVRFAAIESTSAGKPYSGYVSDVGAKVKYCEPVSNDYTAPVEADINSKLGELESYIDMNDANNVVAVCRDLKILLDKRNALAKRPANSMNVTV